MKRYKIFGADSVKHADEAPDGEWVRYEDAQAERTELLGLLKELWGTWEPVSCNNREAELNDRLEAVLKREGLL